MTSVLKTTREFISIGKELHECGRVSDYFALAKRLKDYMTAPVVMNREVRMLHFAQFSRRNCAVNWTATNLFGREGFHIYGPAYLIEKTEKWHCLRVLGDKQDIEANIGHLTFKDTYTIVTMTQFHDRHYVMARDASDIIALKMML